MTSRRHVHHEGSGGFALDERREHLESASDVVCIALRVIPVFCTYTLLVA